MGCINHPSTDEIDLIISVLTLGLLSSIPTKSTHDNTYKTARKEFMRNSLDDPNVAAHIKGWVRQEIRSRGESGYWRSPPGYDVGHHVQGINSSDNFRWENSSMNRSRGGRFGK